MEKHVSRFGETVRVNPGYDLGDMVHEYVENSIVYYKDQWEVLKTAWELDIIGIAGLNDLIGDSKTLAEIAYKILHGYLTGRLWELFEQEE